MNSPSGPLVGIKVIEFAGVGPAPHAAMLLADLGAEVLRIDRPDGNGYPENPAMKRGRSAITLDIRSESGREACLTIANHADALIEGFRPGVMERLGLGPDALCARNPRLVYGRMTGWGQTGPLAKSAGHDINYVALTGALDAIGGPTGAPLPPLNLVGDFGGGSVYLAFGIVSALLERERSGRGQVVDAAIVDGVNSMMAMFSGVVARGEMSLQRDRGLLSGAAPFYRCYECADGRHVSVGAIEPAFYEQLLRRTGADSGFLARQHDVADWPRQSEQLAEIFRTKSRDAWCALLEGRDCCFAPVLSLAESPTHPQMVARACHVDVDGVHYGAPAPRFSRTPGTLAPRPNGEQLLQRWGVATGGTP